MSSVLRDILDKLVYLEFSACVYCNAGDVSLEMTQNGLLAAEPLILSKGKRGKVFKISEVDILIEYLGDITRIITLDHNTDEEIVYNF
jgi:hypothetical protein